MWNANAVNDLNPTPATLCIIQLPPVEKFTISKSSPIVAIYKKGSSSSSEDQIISFYQDATELGTTLSRFPKDLQFIVIKSPNDELTDKIFHVNRSWQHPMMSIEPCILKSSLHDGNEQPMAMTHGLQDSQILLQNS